MLIMMRSSFDPSPSLTRHELLLSLGSAVQIRRLTMRGMIIKPEVCGGLEAARKHAGAGALRGVRRGVRVGNVARELREVTRAGAVVVACA